MNDDLDYRRQLGKRDGAFYLTLPVAVVVKVIKALWMKVRK